MVLKKANHERVKLLLKNTIVLLCKNGLDFNEKIDIECLIGLTLDDKDVVLMSLHEVINSDGSINIEEVESIRDEPTDDDGDSDPDYKTHKAKKSIAPSRSTQVATRSQQSQGPKRKRGRPPKYKKNTNDKAENANKQQEQAQTTPAQNIQIKEETLEENILTGDTSADVVMETAMFRELERLEASDPQVSAGVSVWSDILDNSAQPSQQSDADLTTVTSALSQESHEQDKSSELDTSGGLYLEAAEDTFEDDDAYEAFDESVDHSGWNTAPDDLTGIRNYEKINKVQVKWDEEAQAKRRYCLHPGCDYSTLFRSHMSRHQKGHSNCYDLCPICGKKFTTKNNLSAHIESVHEKKVFYCNFCGKSYASKQGLAHHEKTHVPTEPKEPNHKCRFCDRGYDRLANYITHVQTHPEYLTDLEYQADLAEKKKAAQQLTLEKEKKGKTRHCSYAGCDYTSKYRASMHRHRKRVHTNVYHQCPICNSKFFENYDFRKHLETAHDFSNNMCDLCGERLCKETIQQHRNGMCCAPRPTLVTA